MTKKFLFYSSFLSLLVLSLFVSSSASAAIDSEGYEYTVAKANEIDFAKENIFIELISGDPTDENALYAVYTDEVLEQYKKDHNLVDVNAITPFAIASKGFSYYYKSSKWITRSGVVSLSIDPKANAWTGSSIAGNVFKQKDRWDVIVKKHSGSKNWKNSASLKAQLNCHADLAKSVKTPWNLEPHRKTTNYAVVLKHLCNAPN